MQQKNESVATPRLETNVSWRRDAIAWPLHRRHQGRGSAHDFSARSGGSPSLSSTNSAQGRQGLVTG